MVIYAVVQLITALFLLSNDQAVAFDKVKTSRTAAGLAQELADLGLFGSQRAVIVRNTANDGLRIWCSSRDDNTGEKRLNPGESLSFVFKPLVIGGGTIFWCTVDYKTFWALWDAFGYDVPYPYSDKNKQAYVYEVRHDGVYYEGRKFRGLAEGRYGYKLWEHYDENKNPHGMTLSGFVDEGMCNNIPNWMQSAASAATVCNNTCIILYSDIHCRGQTSRLHVSSGCINFWFTFFNDKAKSVKGC